MVTNNSITWEQKACLLPEIVTQCWKHIYIHSGRIYRMEKQNKCQIVCISHYHTINCNFDSGKCGGTKLDIFMINIEYIHTYSVQLQIKFFRMLIHNFLTKQKKRQKR